MSSTVVSTSHSETAAANANESSSLLHELRELALVARPSIDREPAARGHDVGAVPPSNQADVRGRLLVDATEPEIRDGASGRDDRRAAVLGVDPGVRRASREEDVDRPARGSRDDHLADGARVVIDEAESSLEPRHVERESALETRFFPGGEEQLDAGVPAPLGEDEPCGLEQHRNRRLVVGSQDRSRPVRDDSVRDNRLDRPGGRHRVEMRAEKDRLPGLAFGRGQTCEEIACGVGVCLDAQIAQVGAHPLGDGRLLPRRARNGRQLQKEREDVGGPGRRHESILGARLGANRRISVTVSFPTGADFDVTLEKRVVGRGAPARS